MWLRGEVLPPSSTCLFLPEVLYVDLVEASVDWLLCERQKLERALQCQVLKRLGLASSQANKGIREK